MRFSFYHFCTLQLLAELIQTCRDVFLFWKLFDRGSRARFLQLCPSNNESDCVCENFARWKQIASPIGKRSVGINPLNLYVNGEQELLTDIAAPEFEPRCLAQWLYTRVMPYTVRIPRTVPAAVPLR
ncbi:hypothetical protein J6590_024040 [Homalodisca vitripennis]|nr:hypothetical protein J6590_024040 [Homalodisca vitripennis]